jgi:hypothetical protein
MVTFRSFGLQKCITVHNTSHSVDQMYLLFKTTYFFEGSGCCIEDKCFPKTNSLLDGRQQPLADVEEFSLKIKVSETVCQLCKVKAVILFKLCISNTITPYRYRYQFTHFYIFHVSAFFNFIKIQKTTQISNLPHSFPHYLFNDTLFSKKLLNLNCVFWFPLQLLCETFFILRSIMWDINSAHCVVFQIK